MRWRWLAWTGGIGAIALLALMPLRIALAGSDLGKIGFTARQVAGTIWYGRIGDLQLRSQPLGTFEVTLDPFALLVGKASAGFNRMDSPEGPLRGRLIAGTHRGIVDTSGRLALAGLFAPIPIEAVELTDATILFRNGRCVEASGQVRPIFAGVLPGIDLGASTTARLQCEGERVRILVGDPARGGQLDFYIQSTGRYRGWIRVRDSNVAVAATLAGLGFRQSGDGLTLTADGRL